MYMAVILKKISQNVQILLSFPSDYAEKYVPIFFWVDIYILCPPFAMNQINSKDELIPKLIPKLCTSLFFSNQKEMEFLS